jgi:very-short-patch-repair endonuclease
MVFPNNDGGTPTRVVSPIFVIQVEFEIQSDMLHLQPVGPVEINHGWLERRFAKPDDRRVFMELIGLDRPERDEEGEPEPPATACLSDLQQSLFHCYKEWWKEFADPTHPSTTPPLQEIDSRGVYNRVVLMGQPGLKYSGRLYAELLWLAQRARDEDLDQTALRLLFPHDPPLRAADNLPGSSGAEPFIGVAEYEGLNSEQRAACKLALTSPLSVVTGPPGTGKSRVVAQAMANAAIRRTTVLFSSRNHQAVEAVIPRLNGIVEPEALAIRLARPFGETTAESLTQAIINLLNSPRPGDVANEIRRKKEKLDDLLRRREAADQARARVFGAFDELDKAENTFEDARGAMSGDAGERMRSAGTMTSETAIANAYAAIQGLLTPPQTWLSRMIWRLRRWLRGRRLVAAATAVDREYSQHFQTTPLDLPAIDDSKQMGRLLRTLERWSRMAQGITAARQVQQLQEELELLPSLESCHEQYQEHLEQMCSLTTQLLRLISTSFGAGLTGVLRQRFAEVRAALQTSSGDLARQASKVDRMLAECFPQLIKEMPLWATVNLSVSRNVPRAPGAFDLLIIDEASQCDIASVVPLLYRARRALVVGDPMQLPHVSTLRSDVERRLRKRFELTDISFGRFSYSVNSFYDLASTEGTLEARIQLQEHHRCHPVIAGYCNDTFYRKTLRVMTDVGSLKSPMIDGEPASGFRWTAVPADTQSGQGSGAISRGQARAIVDELKRLRHDHFPGTIGVVSPFRAQVNRISDLVQEEMGPDLPEHWRFHADTADGFQGDERDVILLSLPGGTDMPRGSLWFLGHGKNRFNVAVSRARALLHVFADDQWCRTCGIPHVTELVKSWERQKNSPRQNFRADLVGPVWEPKLADALRAAGISFQQQYPACGRYLDFAIIRSGLRLDLEVDGEAYHRGSDGLRKIDDLYRDLTLIGHGWRVMRFWVYQLRENLDDCVAKIRAAYESAD